MNAEQQGLNAQKQDSFQQITDQANRRGLFYSGLPIAEEQRYTGQQFLPAVANLHAKYATQKFSLQDAIAKVTADQYNRAYGVRQNELDLEEKQREFDRQLAAQQEAARRAAAASAGPGGISLGGGAGGATAPSINPLSAATDYANALKQQYYKTGNIAGATTFARDQALALLKQQYGNVLTAQQLNSLVYQTVFPDNWAGGATKTNAYGYDPSFGGSATIGPKR